MEGTTVGHQVLKAKWGELQFWKHAVYILGTKSKRDLEKKKFHYEQGFSISKKDEKQTHKSIFVLVRYKTFPYFQPEKVLKLILFPKPIYTYVTNTFKQK